MPGLPALSPSEMQIPILVSLSELLERATAVETFVPVAAPPPFSASPTAPSEADALMQLINGNTAPSPPLCEHEHDKNSCKTCNRSKIGRRLCKHLRQKSQCNECGKRCGDSVIRPACTGSSGADPATGKYREPPSADYHSPSSLSLNSRQRPHLPDEVVPEAPRQRPHLPDEVVPEAPSHNAQDPAVPPQSPQPQQLQ
jgi:hypothetical protein